LLNDLPQLIVNLVFGVGDDGLEDLHSKVLEATARNSRLEVSGLDLLEEGIEPVVEEMSIMRAGEGGLALVANIEILQEAGKENVEVGRDNSGETLDLGEDCFSLDTEIYHPRVGSTLGLLYLAESLQGGEDKPGKLLVLIEPGGDGHLLNVHHSGLYLQHGDEGGDIYVWLGWAG
jgi:hypothetical protein